MKDLQRELGSETDLEVSFKEGKAIIAVKYDGKGADASVSIALEAGYFIDKITAAIPGDWDDALGEMLKAALKAQK